MPAVSILSAILLLAEVPASAPLAAPDVAVVCPAEFRAALAPWTTHRTKQGHRIAWLSNTQSAQEIRDGIRRIAKLGRLRYVVLIGDADPRLKRQPEIRTRSVPVHQAQAKVNIRWGSEPTIATDNWYADLDDDHVPDVAVGRLTADSKEELQTIVTKILAYEKSDNLGLWRRRVNFVAGVGGFGRFADALLETTTKKFISDGLPAAYDSTMTYASWRSPYCPNPTEFCDATLNRLNEGCLFWVYIGHGHYRTLDQIRVPNGRHRILDVRDIPRLRCTEGSPIAFFMACYTGAFDAVEDCLAEEMLRKPGAPVAIISGSRVTMPYAMAVLGTALLDECFVKRQPTVGDALLAAKRRLVAAPGNDENRQMLEMLAKVVSPAPDELAAERTEHLHLFNLIGDPLLRLRQPEKVSLELPKVIYAGQPIEIIGRSPVAGTCYVELVVRRDRLTFKPPARDRYDSSPMALSDIQDIYLRANDPRLVSSKVAISEGPLRVTLEVPSHARGACHVRVFVEGANRFALGASDIQVSLPKSEKPGR